MGPTPAYNPAPAPSFHAPAYPAAAAGPPAGGPPRASSAPQHSAAPVVAGTPVPWPLPTSTQQKLSTTSSVAEQNKAVQEGSGAVALGDLMAPHELSHVKGVLGMLLEMSSQDGNARKKEDHIKRLEDLYNKLQSGQMRTAASQKVLHLVKSVEAQDYKGANKTMQELSAIDWDQNKNWIQGVRR